MTDLNTLRASLNSGEHLFADTLAFIAAHYNYQPQAFQQRQAQGLARTFVLPGGVFHEIGRAHV